MVQLVPLALTMLIQLLVPGVVEASAYVKASKSPIGMPAVMFWPEPPDVALAIFVQGVPADLAIFVHVVVIQELLESPTRYV